MSCCIENEGAKLKVKLTFEREQLLYDIKNNAYVESHIMAPETEHAKHMVADVGEEGNVDRVTRVLDLSDWENFDYIGFAVDAGDRVTRVLDLGISMCREMLYPWSKKEIVKLCLDDKLKEREQYHINMSVPNTISQTTLTYVERLIHEYLVCRGVADWLSITNPSKSETWLAKAAEAEQEIRTSIHSRMERKRIRQHWLG